MTETVIRIVIPGAREARGKGIQRASVRERNRARYHFVNRRADARSLGSLPSARFARLAGNDNYVERIPARSMEVSP